MYTHTPTNNTFVHKRNTKTKKIPPILGICGIFIHMKKTTIGILAHVDAGKTTLIESMLFNAGNIRKLGRVDHQDAFLDFDNQERNRGITIFSKQAYMTWKDTEIYIIDTPGHIDFSSEMERSLQILDMAILLINSQDGIQSHTQTIWDCLKQYSIPTLIFFNKMDISYHEQMELYNQVTEKLSPNCIDLSQDDAYEKLALINDNLLETYMETGTIPMQEIQELIQKRECFPCFFGSALKNQGIEPLMDAIDQYTLTKEYGEEFGAKIYKISQDEQANRLTHIKVTSGTLKTKQKLSETEKIDQIRLYNGKNYTMIQEATAGTVCVLKGLETLEAGQGIGIEQDSKPPLLNAYLNYQLLLPPQVDPMVMMQYCKVIAQEDPQLEIQYDSRNKRIHVQLMGDIQKEVLQNQIEQRSGIQVGFTTGKVVFKETIAQPVRGVGHFEPLRHYAEVHLLLEPLPRNSGLQFEAKIPTDDLALNWQRLILTHLQEKNHKGVLTGSSITDMKISLIAGKAHQKHTVGGDFRQATYRAVRQGLKKAQSLLLEPYYRFEIQVPTESLSKTLFDLETKQAKVEIQDNLDQTMTIKGTGPVRHLINYQNDIIAYTHGKGKFSCQLDGYEVCQDAEAIIDEIGYDSELDTFNPTGSVFCAHGSGYTVPYNEVEDYMHILPRTENTSNYRSVKYNISEEEIKRVFDMSSGRNKNEKKLPVKKKPKVQQTLEPEKVKIKPIKPTCLIVDGYNMIYDWSDLQKLIREDIEMARDQLIHYLVNYTGYKNWKLLLVFDAYRIKSNTSRNYSKGNTTIVYTRYNQTADSYIEKIVPELKKEYQIIVATSDGLIQNSILAQGATRISARELENKVKNINAIAMKDLKSRS